MKSQVGRRDLVGEVGACVDVPRDTQLVRPRTGENLHTTDGCLRAEASLRQT